MEIRKKLLGGIMPRLKFQILILSGVATLLVLGALAMGGSKGIPVNVITAGPEDIQAKVSANGKIQAIKKVEISANVMGQVTRLAVKEGDRVKTGDFLLEIDSVQAKAAVDGLAANLGAAQQNAQQMKLRLSQARNDFKRAEASRQEDIISQADFEQTRLAQFTAETSAQSAGMQMDQAKANLAMAKDALRKSTLTAPMNGLVTARRIEQGETAVVGIQNSPGTVLLTISDMSRVEAEMEVDEASISNVELGQNAKISIDAYPNKYFDGQVTEVGGSPIAKQVQNEGTKFKVKVWIKNPPATIKPGLSAQAEILTGRRPRSLAVPIQALVMKPKKSDGGLPSEDEEGVYLVESGRARFRAVKTGLMGEFNVEIIEGLQGGETVIKGPFKVLREFKEGDSVKILPKD